MLPGMVIAGEVDIRIPWRSEKPSPPALPVKVIPAGLLKSSRPARGLTPRSILRALLPKKTSSARPPLMVGTPWSQLAASDHRPTVGDTGPIQLFTGVWADAD